MDSCSIGEKSLGATPGFEWTSKGFCGIIWKKEVLVRWDQVHEVRFSKGYSYLLNPNTVILKTDAGRIRLSLYWVDRDKPLPEIRFRSKGRLALLKREDGSIQEVQPETSEILTSLKKYLL